MLADKKVLVLGWLSKNLVAEQINDLKSLKTANHRSAYYKKKLNMPAEKRQKKLQEERFVTNRLVRLQ